LVGEKGDTFPPLEGERVSRHLDGRERMKGPVEARKKKVHIKEEGFNGKVPSDKKGKEKEIGTLCKLPT